MNSLGGEQMKHLKKIMIGCMAVTLFLSGCNKEQATPAQAAAGEPVTLKVYYVENGFGYDSIILKYRASNVKIETTKFNSDLELANQYATEAATKDGADVILLSDTSQIDVYKAIKGGNVADLTELLNSDNNYTYNTESYYKAVIDAGKFEEGQYVIPFTFETPYLFARESILEKLGLDTLEPQTDFKALASTLFAYQEKLNQADKLRFSIKLLNDKGLESDLLYFVRGSGMPIVDYSTGKAILDKEQLKLVSDLSKAIKEEELEKKEAISQEYNGYQIIDAAGFLYGCNGFVVNSKSLWNTYAAVLGENSTWFGTPGFESNTYHANIKDYGIVDKNSKNIQQAYSFLRYMMDNKEISYEPSAGIPVKKSNAEEIMENIKKQSTLMLGNQKVQLPEFPGENKEAWEQVLNNITNASLINGKIEKIIADSMADYMNDESDFDTCYETLVNKLNLYLFE
jgi:ABC-type glycerol-3-phosphate transport system substrate-binding protein